MLRTEKLRTPEGGDEDIRLAANRGKIRGARVGHGDRGIRAFGQEQHGHGFADNKAASDDHGAGSAGRDLAGAEQLEAAERRAGDEGGRIFHGQGGHVERMESIDVFARVDGADHGRFVDLLRGGGLDEDAVDGRVGIETGDEADQFFLRGGDG